MRRPTVASSTQHLIHAQWRRTAVRAAAAHPTSIAVLRACSLVKRGSVNPVSANPRRARGRRAYSMTSATHDCAASPKSGPGHVLLAQGSRATKPTASRAMSTSMGIGSMMRLGHVSPCALLVAPRIWTVHCSSDAARVPIGATRGSVDRSAVGDSPVTLSTPAARVSRRPTPSLVPVASASWTDSVFLRIDARCPFRWIA